MKNPNLGGNGSGSHALKEMNWKRTEANRRILLDVEDSCWGDIICYVTFYSPSDLKR